MPWDAPIAFELDCAGGDAELLHDGPRKNGATYVFVGPGQGQTPEGVMADAGIVDGAALKLRQLTAWKRIELYSDR
jgi:hypothetical protein